MDGKLIVVSNRLPYSVAVDRGKASLTQSDGGLISGMKHVMEENRVQWIGCAGIRLRSVERKPREAHEALLRDKGCVPVYLDRAIEKGFYDGYSNSMLWPLFHGFPQAITFDEGHWKAYREANRCFLAAVQEVYEHGDTVWVHDYHLMLLPKMLRECYPSASIGFFLHIPFPSHELFQIIPERKELLEGVLGADLVGFHVYDYVRHFLSSTRRLLGIEDKMGVLEVGHRYAKADAFPMGIDFDRYHAAAKSDKVRILSQDFRNDPKRAGCKTLLSIERLDYTKGIPEQLEAYDTLFEQHPEWIEKVVLSLVAVPSREGVGSYKSMKRRTDGLVGRINGKYATTTWAPIEYYYRSIPLDLLVSLYATSDVMVVAPLRDGMNLVCKEYLASRIDGDGVLILSEMAGASAELSDALIVNPFNHQQMVDALHQALVMPREEQRQRNTAMIRRLRRYTSKKWTSEFLSALQELAADQQRADTKKLSAKSCLEIMEAFSQAQKRVLLLDYDGTLVPFCNDPRDAAPDDALVELLKALCGRENTDLVLISGRDKDILEEWFSDLPVDIVAEHGVWRRRKAEGIWHISEPMDDSWKSRISAVLDNYVDRTPGSFVEEKDFSLVWHYRACAKELSERRLHEVKLALTEEAVSFGLMLMDGDKVLEIKPSGIGKGSAANLWYMDETYDFVLVIGDDTTDEDMFHAAPEGAWTIKVGAGQTDALYSLGGPSDVRALLRELASYKTMR